MANSASVLPGVWVASIGIRASTWSSVFMVGAGGPGGVRLPWGKAERRKMKDEMNRGSKNLILINKSPNRPPSLGDGNFKSTYAGAVLGRLLRVSQSLTRKKTRSGE